MRFYVPDHAQGIAKWALWEIEQSFLNGNNRSSPSSQSKRSHKVCYWFGEKSALEIFRVEYRTLWSELLRSLSNSKQHRISSNKLFLFNQRGKQKEDEKRQIVNSDYLVIQSSNPLSSSLVLSFVPFYLARVPSETLFRPRAKSLFKANPFQF